MIVGEQKPLDEILEMLGDALQHLAHDFPKVGRCVQHLPDLEEQQQLIDFAPYERPSASLTHLFSPGTYHMVGSGMLMSTLKWVSEVPRDLQHRGKPQAESPKTPAYSGL